MTDDTKAVECKGSGRTPCETPRNCNIPWHYNGPPITKCISEEQYRDIKAKNTDLLMEQKKQSDTYEKYIDDLEKRNVELENKIRELTA